jgi:hypothetical protein
MICQDPVFRITFIAKDIVNRGKKTAARMGGQVAPRSMFRVRFGSVRFYCILVVVILGLHLVESVIRNFPMVETLPEKEIAAQFRQKQLEVWSEMNKLLIAVATVTIGAVGGFMLNRDKTAPLLPQQMHRAAASWFFCALSLYFGYLSYQQATWMLTYGIFNPFNPRLWWPARAQFWTYLLSLVLFADFIYGSIQNKGQAER